MRAHQLDADSVILNTIEVDSLDFMPGLIDADIGGSIGDSVPIIYGVRVVVKKASDQILVPENVDRLQARLALLDINKWNLIQPVIDGFDEPTKSIAQAYFEDANQWYRQDQFVLMIAPLIGLDAAALDAVFISAGQL